MPISNIIYSFFNKMSGGSGGGDGEINTGTNIGDSGIGVYDSKLGAELRFRKLDAASSKLTIIRNGEKIDIDISDENLDILSSQITDSNTPLGVVLLNAAGKIDSSYLPASSGELTFQGSWNANTNTPDLWTNRDSYSNGFFWIVSESGTTDLDGETDWEVGDLIFKVDGGTKEFEKIDQTDKVLSVNGESGEVETHASAGFISCSGVIDNGDGTVTVGNEEVILYPSSDFIGNPKKYLLTGGTFTCPVESTVYLVGDYNSGSPIFRIISDVELITESNILPYCTLYRNGANVIHVIDWDCMGNGLINKIHQRLVKTDRFARESGLIIDEDSSLHLTITSGKFWYGGVRKTFSAYNSTLNDFRLYHHSSGDWTFDDTRDTLINNQYDNGTDLQTLPNNEYVNNWIYICGESTSWAYIILGDSYNKLADALSENIPILPEYLRTHGVLLGRITYKKDISVPERLVTAFEEIFNANIPIDHSDLTGLLDSDVHPATSISGFETEVMKSTGNVRKEPTGFVDKFGADLFFDDSTRILTVAPAGTSYDIYVLGNKFTISTTKTITITDTAGEHWIFFGTDGELHEYVNPTNGESRELILEKCLVSYVSWNGTESTFVNRETHGILMNGEDHLYFHVTVGARYVSGLALQNYINDGDGSLNTSFQIGISDGTIFDEDLPAYISETNYTQLLNSVLNAPILYKSGSGGLFTYEPASNKTGINIGTGRIAYNNMNAGGASVWGLTEVPDKSYVNMYIIGTPDINNPVKIILGQNYYNTLEEARDSSELSTLNLEDINEPEFKFLHKYTLYSRNLFANDMKAILYYDFQHDDLRSSVTGEATIGLYGQNHNDLINRDALNAHPATAIGTDSSTFDKILSTDDTDLQTALDTIDEHNHNLSELDDVSITSISDGQMLTWDNTLSKWVNSDMSEGGVLHLSDLLDTEIVSPEDGDFLVWNSLKGQWENSVGYSDKIVINDTAFSDILSGGEINVQEALETLDTHGHPSSDITDLTTTIDDRIGLSIIDDLNDTNVGSPIDGQVITWDDTTSKWIAETPTDTDTDNLNDLTDTDLTTIAEGDILKYNSTSNWENQKDTKTVGLTLGAKDTDLDLISSYPIYAPFSGTIKRVIGVVNTAPTGADIIIDININGTSIWNTTQANRLTISASSTSGTQTTFDTTSITEGNIITVDIDQIGSTIAGQDLTVLIEINKS